MGPHYVSNGSPFGDAYDRWLDDCRTVAEISTGDLDEFASCARSILSTPCYAADPFMAEFRDQLEAEALARLVCLLAGEAEPVVESVRDRLNPAQRATVEAVGWLVRGYALRATDTPEYFELEHGGRTLVILPDGSVTTYGALRDRLAKRITGKG